MRYFKKSLALLLTAMFIFGLAACGDAEEEAGADWRTTGVVVANGTIAHDGDRVDVLVTIDSESAAFYWDEAEQVLFDSVAFPWSIPDAKTAFEGISFDDIDGDGETDVSVDFLHVDKSETHLVWIWDAEERYVYYPELSWSKNMSSSYIANYVGLWKYAGADIWLHVEDDASWEFLDADQNTLDSGVVWADDSGVVLSYDGSDDLLVLELSAGGDLLDQENGSSLSMVERIQSTTASFEKNALSLNAALDGGSYLLKNGVASYSGLGDGYNTGDCYWEVRKLRDDRHDGIREIEFDAICYIPAASIPNFSQQYMTVTGSELYDYYSGMWLTASTAYNDTNRGENHYVHKVSWAGRQYEIEFFYSTDWKNDVGDWGKVLTKSYVVYLPEDYDGLILAAQAQPGSYKESQKRDQLDSICPEANIMRCETIDPRTSLYFPICG